MTDMKKLRIHLPSSIVHTLIGVALGALASWAISSYFANRTPESVLDIERRATTSLWGRRFADAVADFSRALAIDSTRSVYWEGKAYAHIGQAVGDDFDIGLVARDAQIEQWIAVLATRSGETGALADAYEAAKAAFNTASTDGERIAARYILGLVRELEGDSDYGRRYGFSPLQHYAAALSELQKWKTTPQYESVGDYSSPSSDNYILPWALPWQARTIRPLCTYQEAIDSAFLRRLAAHPPSWRSDYLSSTLRSPELVRQYAERMKAKEAQQEPERDR